MSILWCTQLQTLGKIYAYACEQKLCFWMLFVWLISLKMSLLQYFLRMHLWYQLNIIEKIILKYISEIIFLEVPYILLKIHFLKVRHIYPLTWRSWAREKNDNVNFNFHSCLWCLTKAYYEGLYAVFKTFLRYHKNLVPQIL